MCSLPWGIWTLHQLRKSSRRWFGGGGTAPAHQAHILLHSRAHPGVFETPQKRITITLKQRGNFLSSVFVWICLWDLIYHMVTYIWNLVLPLEAADQLLSAGQTSNIYIFGGFLAIDIFLGGFYWPLLIHLVSYKTSLLEYLGFCWKMSTKREK